MESREKNAAVLSLYLQMAVKQQMMKFFFFGILMLAAIPFYGQELLNRDSLLRLLPRAAEDSSKVLLLISIGQQYEGSEPEKAKAYYRQARDLSKKTGYKLGEIKFAANYTYVLNMQGHYDSSLQLNLAAVTTAKQLGNPEYIVKTLFNTGTSYLMLEEYETALRYYLEAFPLVESAGDKIMTAQAMDIIQSLYTELKQYRKSIDYGLRSVQILRAQDHPYLLAYALNNLGMNYGFLRRFDSALLYYEEALEIGKRIGDKNLEGALYLNMGDAQLRQFRYREVGGFMKKALQLSRETGSFSSEVIALRGLAYHYHANGDHRLSKAYGDSALALATAHGLRHDKQKSYTQLSNLAFAMQDYKLGDWYALQSSLLSDSLLNETIQKHTVELDKKYQTGLKDNQIRLQQANLRNKTIWNYILIGTAATILLISLLGYRNYRNRRKLQQQRILELEKEKQLAATAAVLEGEEQERSRLAKDLHDGLGGMLSGIKYSLHTMKENLILTPDNAQAFERSIDMLDSSIREMRRVAHNMMPEALVKFGLDAALRDFCNEVNRSGALKVSYQSIGLEGHELEQSKAITIYRIVQELLNNVIKHAAASTAMVQVSRTDGILSATVEDNGKGMERELLYRSGGIGWSSIRNRVEFQKGRWDVVSEPGKGSSVYIEFKA